MPGPTSLDLSQIRTDALSSAATFRTLIGVDISSYATAAQGALADSALQPSDITSGTITAGTGDIDFDDLGGGAESPLALIASGATETPLTIQGDASQTANLQEWQNGVGTALSVVDANGDISVNEYIRAMGDSDTYIRFDAANEISMRAGGSLVLYGRSGAKNVTINGSSRDWDTQINWDSGVAFWVQGTTGNVGIGTASPGATLDVDGDATFSGPAKLGAYTFATVPTASSYTGYAIAISDRDYKRAYSDGTDWRFTHDNAVIS